MSKNLTLEVRIGNQKSKSRCIVERVDRHDAPGFLFGFSTQELVSDGVKIKVGQKLTFDEQQVMRIVE